MKTKIGENVQMILVIGLPKKIPEDPKQAVRLKNTV